MSPPLPKLPQAAKKIWGCTPPCQPHPPWRKLKAAHSTEACIRPSQPPAPAPVPCAGGKPCIRAHTHAQVMQTSSILTALLNIASWLSLLSSAPMLSSQELILLAQLGWFEVFS